MFFLSVIFSENRFPLFRIMLEAAAAIAAKIKRQRQPRATSLI
jgi:hypothetical protein